MSWKQYSCCVCGKKASGPLWVIITKNEHWDAYGAPQADFEGHYDYDFPDDLTRCPICEKWYCSDHWSADDCARKRAEKETREYEARKPDWQKKIDAQQRREHEERLRSERERKEEKERAHIQELAEERARLACHICGRQPVCYPYVNVSKLTFNDLLYVRSCTICGEPVCGNCSYNGVCRKCGDKL
jgi:hypothetical protein